MRRFISSAGKLSCFLTCLMTIVVGEVVGSSLTSLQLDVVQFRGDSMQGIPRC